MNTISNEQAKDLRNAFECWQQDYDPVEDKEQYGMFGLGILAMDELLAMRKEREKAERPQSELSQRAQQILRDATSLAERLRAETDTTSQQFESLAGKAVLPAGWKLVPAQPTQAMCDAVLGRACFTFNGDGAKRIYEAMLGAAPEPCK
ncbi:hypothetical protein ACMUBS_000596 [Cronobacter turicensis]